MKQKLADLGKIFLTVFAISVMHYYTSYTSTEFHAFSALLYYIPIIFAAFRFGLKGEHGPVFW